MNKIKILLLCNEIGAIMDDIYNTSTMQLCDFEAIDKRLKAIAAEINSHPIEAEPVRRGRWVWVDWSMWGKSNFQCSECDCEMKYMTNYCPRCGAKMDGGAEK